MHGILHLTESLPLYIYHYAGFYGDFSHPNSPFVLPTTYRFDFFINRTSPYQDHDLSSTDLFIFAKISSHGRDELTNIETIQLYHIFEVHKLIHYQPVKIEKRRLVQSKVVDVKEGFIQFDIMSAINRWTEIFGDETGTITFLVVIKPPILLKSKSVLNPMLFFDLRQDKRSLAIIELKYSRITDIENASTAKRRRRQSVEKLDTEFCFANPSEPNCCVKNLKINFVKDLGFDFIIEPLEYTPNYCVGLCPFFWPTLTLSTDFLILYRERNPGSTVKPCCAPNELYPLSMIIKAGRNYTIQHFPNMIVGSCICR
jgi:hypothetical protein